MELRDCDRSDELAAAHADADVSAAAEAFLEIRSASAVGVLKEGLYGGWYPGPGAVDVLLTNNAIADHQRDAGGRLALAALRIGAAKDALRTFRYGAVLEQIVEGLVRERATAVRVEVAVSPMPESWGSTWSTPQDVVVDETPIEFYECKADAGDLENKHLVTFREISDRARDEGRAPFVAFATLSEIQTVQTHVSYLIAISDPVYVSARENLAELADGRPKERANEAA